MKICCKCKTSKSLDDFYKNRATRDGYHKQCKSCHITKKQTRAFKLFYRYKLTEEKFNSIFEAQNKRCAICRTFIPSKKGWVVDHDHLTGEVRGILCNKCNTGIGLLLDNSNIIYLAFKYLYEKREDVRSTMERVA